mmetsp:Transcript_11325/g.39457  ORF Transcript_11325/g.39457 Transcript_11325/m.39457 type:complete len:404 (-) Transcript_11325:154-1365(-)|eukprot:CAMPEP_0203807078 /NCGR_PEP_ID=MMETSP0115-20131106/860_1 /ASSEMBLY_ACC=CAM_ASM_000227 /TAXON_ID=33651 /ORGANISM="Bicosoecid sp, Strain ms1" /LENGTH=403 /DNA_ID=CAMNT_0050715749 /DNA_START=68 /DNA_END=1279 /DNA_ORIENTATION=-
MKTALAVVVVVAATMVAAARAGDPDVGADFPTIVRSKGYPVEEHFVTTTDGYILGTFRIPYGRNEQPPAPGTESKKPVVYLQHGLLDSSYTWVNNFPEQSLGFVLADAGYDVWFGNARGNFYSKRHTKLDPSSAAFWEGVDWDSMASQDIPATVQAILEVTGAKTLSYVGHSQGTTSGFAAFANNHDLAAKVNFFGALAPVAYVHHQSSWLLAAAAGLDIDKLFQLLGVHEFLPNASILQLIDPLICSILPTGCDVILFLICGPTKFANASRMDVYVSETPAGTSVHNLAHWAQGVRSETYQMYDYGCGLFSCDNEKHYGQKTPPGYDLGNVTVPTGLFSGSEDMLADPKDVQQLADDLPASTLVHQQIWQGAAHLDFTWSPDANANVYQDLLKLIAKYNRYD